jgi:hypothetical protein
MTVFTYLYVRADMRGGNICIPVDLLSNMRVHMILIKYQEFAFLKILRGISIHYNNNRG